MTANKDSYNKCLEEMYSLRRFGIKLGLDIITNILEGLGNPQKRFTSIHIAGTNGKGSVASALASILYLSGYKVGLYTSPHLVKFNERICINNHPISDEDIIESYEAVKHINPGDREPTFFEYSTAMALYEFAKHDVDWAVIETGMGGRLDATNVMQPALSVITNISLEHETYLGNTIAEITGEKGGIIKEGIPVVTGVKQESAIAVLEEIAQEKSAPLYRLGDMFRVERDKDGAFSYFGIDETWHNMRTGLSGNYQVDNAALVLAGCEILGKEKAILPFQHIRKGLEENRWPGRLEVVSTSPFILMDGAHNLVAAKNLANFLSENIADRQITLIIGVLDDKPYEPMLSSLLPVCSKVILTCAKTERSLPTDRLHSVAQKFVRDITIIPDVDKAVNHAIETASPTDMTCIAGSLYVVGEAKEALEERGISSFQLRE